MAVLQLQLPRVLQDVDGKPQHVSNSLWAWSELELPMDDHREAASKAVLRAAPVMVREDVVQVSWAHHCGGWQLSAAAMEAVEARQHQLRKPKQWK